MQVFVLKKSPNRHDDGECWIFSSEEKLESFKKKFNIEYNAEQGYYSYTTAIDPLAL